MKKDKTINLTRLQEYLALLGETNEKRAKAIGYDTSTITKLWNGQRQPSIDMLKNICTKCNCSIDYLFNLTDAKTRNIEIQSICDYIGLNEDAIDYLHNLTKDRTTHSLSFPITRIDVINAFFDADNDIRETFDDVLQQIILYLITCTKLFPIKENQISENLKSIYPAFFYLEFKDLMMEIELHQNRITQSIEKLVADTKLAVAFDCDTGEYVDFQSAMNSEYGEFTSIDEIINNNRKIFKKYEFDIWQNYDFAQAQIMLYEDKIKTLKELHQNVTAQKDGENNGKQENT